MAATTKKPTRKQPKPLRGGGRRPAPKTKLSRTSAATRADAVERKKIGETLDVAAFMAHHQQNSASAVYWEEKE
jgi:hypothetical protein